MIFGISYNFAIARKSPQTNNPHCQPQLTQPLWRNSPIIGNLVSKFINQSVTWSPAVRVTQLGYRFSPDDYPSVGRAEPSPPHKIRDIDGERGLSTRSAGAVFLQIPVFNSFTAPPHFFPIFHLRIQMMKTTVQTNLSLLERLVKLLPGDLDSAQDLLADTFVWHYFNPALPEINGDYEGLEGLRAFFEKLAAITNNTFDVKIHQTIPVGEELVVVHANPSMTFAGDSFELDAVVVWRIVGNRITEAWDIPAVHTVRPTDGNFNLMSKAA